MKHFRHFSILAAFAMLAAVGCSSTDQPLPAPTYPHVTYAKGTTYTYYQDQLDANGNVVAGSGDTIHSTVVDTAFTYQGRKATVLVNTHSNGSANDTTFIAQDSGNFWHYNYGLESLNTNQAVLTYNGGKPVVAGWVEQSQLGAASGVSWIAANTTVIIASSSASLVDTATEASDETITVNGAAVTTKHSVHHVKVTALLGSASGTIDTYVSPDYGIVKNIVHPSSVNLGGTQTSASGQELFLLRKN